MWAKAPLPRLACHVEFRTAFTAHGYPHERPCQAPMTLTARSVYPHSRVI